MGRCLVFVAAIAACTKSNPGATCTNGSCSDPRYPFCDATGAIGGTAGTCIAVRCQPGEIHGCDGDQAWTCNAAGDGYDLNPCSLGCSDQPMPHCKYLQPRYLPDVCDTSAQMDQLAITNSGMIDPNLDQTCTGGVVSQPSAPDICVVHYGTIKVTSGATLTIAGKADTTGRAVALVADQDAVIDGILDVSAHTSTNGPGGGAFSSGANSGGPDINTIYGGGGAGGATAGGPGGSVTSGGGGTDGGAMNGGAPTANPALLAALIGGGSSFNYNGKTYGGGGGALTVISCHGTVRVSGTINAGGGGGPGGMFVVAVNIPGYGGGAGGNVVLQGANVSITGQLFANGGGGGAGPDANGLAGSDGEDGSTSDASPASGGIRADAGSGGAGGFAGAPPGPGGHPTASGASPGGGGGSVGFLQVYVPAGVTPTITPSHVSPALQPTAAALTR